MAADRTRSQATAVGAATPEEKIPPTHPGDVIRADVLEPLGMSQNELARALGVNRRRISEIVNGKRSVTADTALRLGKYLGMSAEFWLGLQSDYDLDVAADKLEDVLQGLQQREPSEANASQA